jgi:hypothetical protein
VTSSLTLGIRHTAFIAGRTCTAMAVRRFAKVADGEMDEQDTIYDEKERASYCQDCRSACFQCHKGRQGAVFHAPELKELLDAWEPLTPEQRATVLQVVKPYQKMKKRRAQGVYILCVRRTSYGYL